MWAKIIKEIRDLMEAAMIAADIPPEGIEWTAMRWDTPDVTAAWPRDAHAGGIRRNIHGWIKGDWPRYSLEIEGSAWRDDEGSGGRYYRKVSWPPHSWPVCEIVASGSIADPVITIVNEADLRDDLDDLVVIIKHLLGGE